MQVPVSPRRSKRSKKVALTTMAAIGGGAMLSACGGEAAPAANAAAKEKMTEVTVFENSFVCAKETGKPRQECDTMRDEALARAEKDAPRFEALQDCEQQHGQGYCVENGFTEESREAYMQDRQRSFSPFMIAWFSRGANNVPLFKGRGEGYQSANGTRLGFAGAPGKYHASARAFERAKSVPAVKAASRLAKRAGFGDRNRSWNVRDRDGSKSGASSARSKGG